MLQFEFDFREHYIGSGRRPNPDAYITVDTPCRICGSRMVYKSALLNKKNPNRRCVPCQRRHSFAVSRRKSNNPMLKHSVAASGLTAGQVKQKIRKKLRQAT